MQSKEEIKWKLGKKQAKIWIKLPMRQLEMEININWVLNEQFTVKILIQSKQIIAVNIYIHK